MFTGLIEQTGILKNKIKKGSLIELIIEPDIMWDDLALGESIAVNGVCLTVTEFKDNYFKADISLPTMEATTLGEKQLGAKINLERALKIGDRLGGHLVQGHIDGKAKLINIIKDTDNIFLSFNVEKDVSKYLILKGSVTIDGISLTIQELTLNTFKVVIIPHTFSNTALTDLRVGDYVNIEVDVLSKYIEKHININKQNLTQEFLTENGFM